MEKLIRVLIADDQPFIRQGLRYIIDAQSDMECVGKASDGEDAHLLSKDTVQRVHVDAPKIIFITILIMQEGYVERICHFFPINNIDISTN